MLAESPPAVVVHFFNFLIGDIDKRDLILQKIPGIGTITAKAILRHFGSLEKIKQATREELIDVEAITKKRAKILYDFFHPPQES